LVGVDDPVRGGGAVGDLGGGDQIASSGRNVMCLGARTTTDGLFQTAIFAVRGGHVEAVLVQGDGTPLEGPVEEIDGVRAQGSGDLVIAATLAPPARARTGLFAFARRRGR